MIFVESGFLDSATKTHSTANYSKSKHFYFCVFSQVFAQVQLIYVFITNNYTYFVFCTCTYDVPFYKNIDSMFWDKLTAGHSFMKISSYKLSLVVSNF